MCIQDNPRYIKLVEMGMPDNVYFVWEYWSEWGTLCIGTPGFPAYYIMSGRTPEYVFDKMFSYLEEYYASHQ